MKKFIALLVLCFVGLQVLIDIEQEARFNSCMLVNKHAKVLARMRVADHSWTMQSAELRAAHIKAKCNAIRSKHFSI